MQTMYAISIRQPWLWAICRGGKDVENRSNRRGAGQAMAQFNKPGRTILLHASSTWEGQAAYDRVNSLSPVDPGISGAPRSDTAWFGESGFVAIAYFDGIHTAHACVDDETAQLCSPWADPDAAHLQLRDVQVLHRPVRYPGRLGMFDVDDANVLAEIRRQAA